MRPAVRLVCLLTSLLIVLPAWASANPEALQRLEAAVAQHPDDPDLRWLYARALVEAHESERALAVLDELLSRWPERRASAWLLEGQLLAAAGRHEDAIASLRRALALDPGLGAAQLQLGLSLRALGSDREADSHLAAAAASEPGLRGEVLLLRALSRLDVGDVESAHAMLRETIELDPTSEAAASAQLLLGERNEAPLWKRLQVEAWAGAEFDSNVTLDNGDIAGLSRNRNDVAGVWGTSVGAEVYRGERVGISMGTRYDARRYADLNDYDSNDLLAFLSARVSSTEWLTLRFDAVGSQSFLAEEPYASSVGVMPNFLFLLGDRAGVLRTYASAAAVWYDDHPPGVFAPLDRDGFSFGGGLEHLVAIPAGLFLPQGLVSLSLDYRHQLTTADRVAAFEGDYDHDRVGGRIATRFTLPWLRTDVELTGGIAGEFYRNDNLVDLLNRPLGSAPRKRDDLELEAGLSLVTPITSYLDLQLAWDFRDRRSNTRVYGFDRHLASAQLRVHGL